MPGSDASRMFLVECYWPGVSDEKLAAASERARSATREVTCDGGEVELLGSVLVSADETVFWFFEGREADIRTVSERAELPFERVLESSPTDMALHAHKEDE